MRKKSVYEIIRINRLNTKRRIIRNATRGAARPWTLEKAREVFQSVPDKREKVRLFNENIGNLFPLILDLVAHGWGLPRIEKSLGLTPRMLWQWLEVRDELAEEVRRARGLRGKMSVGADAYEAP